MSSTRCSSGGRPGVPRLVLVPGLGLDQRSSARLRRLVAADVVLLPGLGRRAPVPSLDALAAGLVDRLGEGPIALVGHSQSCQVVVAAAGDPRVAGLVLLGPTTDPRLRRLRVGPRAMAALWRAAAPDRIDVRLARVAVPVLVVRGTRDALCPHDWAAALAACAPRGRLAELPGAAHMTVQTHPDDVARLIADLIGDVSGDLSGGRTDPGSSAR